MNCPDISELERFVTQSLSDYDARSVQDHLSSCGPCRALTEEVRDNLSLARSVRCVFDDRSVSAPATAALPGVHGFRALRELGRGGMGVVYEAEQDRPRRRVALKVLDALRPLPHIERLFAREVRALARLRHPGIAAIFETGQTVEGRSYFAMELVEGVGLREFMHQRSEWPIRNRLQLFREICDAIAYAHERGVLHRDIKPALDTGRADEAEPQLRESLEIRRQIDPHSLDAASSLENLGLAEMERGRTDEAEILIRESLDIRRTVLGDRHPRLANNLAMLGPILERKGEWIAAEDSYREALAILRETHGEEHPEIGRILQRLGRNLGQQGRLDDSETVLRRALDMQRRLLGEDHANVGSIHGELGVVLMRREQPAEAATFFRNQVHIYEKRLPPNHPRTSQGRLRLGQAHLKAKEFEAAEDSLQTVYEIARLTPTLAVGDTNLLESARNALIELYEATEQPERAKLLRNEDAQAP